METLQNETKEIWTEEILKSKEQEQEILQEAGQRIYGSKTPKTFVEVMALNRREQPTQVEKKPSDLNTLWERREGANAAYKERKGLNAKLQEKLKAKEAEIADIRKTITKAAEARQAIIDLLVIDGVGPAELEKTGEGLEGLRKKLAEAEEIKA